MNNSIFWYQQLNYWYQKIITDIKNCWFKSNKACHSCGCRSEWLPVCMLKLPVMRNSCGVVAAVEMKVWKSMRKSEKGTGSCKEVFVR